jgi:carbamoyl-phosphate synthase large subunit
MAEEAALIADDRIPPVVAIVTGAGGAAGVAVIAALQERGHRTIGADADATAAGLRLAERWAIVPRGIDPGFVPAVCDLAGRTGANVLISTVTEEMGALVAARDELDAAGLGHWLASAEAVEVCRDKWSFACRCRHAGVVVPPTGLGVPDGIPGPWVVKPRFGRGSRDVYHVDEDEDRNWVLRRVPEPIWQTRVRGQEFTVDVLVAPDGSLASAVPRWRHEVKAGITTKGSTFGDDSLVAKVSELLSVVALTGPANVQGFMTDEGPVFIEVNPRFSGGLPLSLAAGADLVGEYLQGAFGRPLRLTRLSYRTGVTMSRYLDQVFAG